MLRPSFSLRCDSVPFCSAEHPPFAEATITLKGMAEGTLLSLCDREHKKEWQSGITLPLSLPEKRSSLLWEYEAR